MASKPATEPPASPPGVLAFMPRDDLLRAAAPCRREPDAATTEPPRSSPPARLDDAMISSLPT